MSASASQAEGVSLRAYAWLIIPSALVRFYFLTKATGLQLVGDEVGYWEASRELAHGTVSHELFHHPPLWQIILALPASLSADPFYGRLLCAVLGSLTPVLVALLAGRLFGKRCGLVAGLLYAVYPEHVAFSHYLWAEVLAALLFVLASLFFVHQLHEPERKLDLLSAALIVGVALLVKEFALLLFLAMLVTLVSLRRRANYLVLVLLFALPASVFSVWSYVRAGHVFFGAGTDLDEPFRKAGNLKGDSLQGLSKKEAAQKIARAALMRGPFELARFFNVHFAHLWSPNSFPIVRLAHRYETYLGRDWNYPFPPPWSLIYLMAGFQVAIVALGLAGLFAGPLDAPRSYAAAVLMSIALFPFLVWLVSRHRLPFMFIFFVYGARFLVDWRDCLRQLRGFRLVGLASLLAVLARVSWLGFQGLGFWG